MAKPTFSDWRSFMLEALSQSRPPLALIASDQEWSARSFESILSPVGYAILRASSSAQALDQVGTVEPDVVFIDARLPDLSGVDLCRLLRGEPNVTAQTPIFLTTGGPVTRQDRLDALRAGASEFVGLPLDTEELLLRLGAQVSAKLDADQARGDSLLDQLTGFYNVRGLLRRVGELGSEASRHRRALACIMVSPELIDSSSRLASMDDASVRAELSRLLRDACRGSDAVAHLGENEYAVLAPNTDPEGAARFANRLTAAAETVTGDLFSGIKLRVGFYAVPDFQEASIQPTEMLVRATTALRRSQTDSGPQRIRSFDLQPPISLS